VIIKKEQWGGRKERLRRAGRAEVRKHNRGGLSKYIKCMYGDIITKHLKWYNSVNTNKRKTKSISQKTYIIHVCMCVCVLDLRSWLDLKFGFLIYKMIILL
jgi:hypothetical protein